MWQLVEAHNPSQRFCELWNNGKHALNQSWKYPEHPSYNANINSSDRMPNSQDFPHSREQKLYLFASIIRTTCRLMVLPLQDISQTNWTNVWSLAERSRVHIRALIGNTSFSSMSRVRFGRQIVSLTGTTILTAPYLIFPRAPCATSMSSANNSSFSFTRPSSYPCSWVRSFRSTVTCNLHVVRISGLCLMLPFLSPAEHS